MSEGLQHTDILARYLNRELSEEQLVQEAEGMDELLQAIKASESLSVPSSKTNEQAWDELQSRLAEEESSAKVVAMQPQSNRLFMRVAAAVLVLAATYFLWPKNTTTVIETNYAQTQEVSLPDGSQVDMFMGSELAFSKGNWKDERKVSLDGEAFFQVEKGNSFVVETQAGEVKVLGTSFNVFQREDEFEVVCYTGKVEVTHHDQQIILEPGEMALIENKQLKEVSLENPALAPNWKKDKFKVISLPMSELGDYFERYYGYKLLMDESIEGKITATFYVNDLESTLKVICKPIELNYIFEKDRTVRLFR
ncbi:MAG: FecR domain-containing protein [Bacteroidota bacterium]